MAFVTIPTRTSSDPNSSADINQLMDNDTYLYANIGGGGATQFDFKPGDFYFPSSNPAPLDTDSGSNGTIKRYLFDASTEEFIESIFILPDSINSGDVTFEVYGYPVTAGAAPNNVVVLNLYHSAIASGESWDSGYTSEASIATCDTTQDVISRFTWTETMSNLGWTASDQVRIRLSRASTAGSDTLVGDFGVTHFRIVLP